jgi:CsoR family transcriptional regulator, copper-sensing transcriptional repressor
MNQLELIHRLNRIQGQIEAIKKNLIDQPNECKKNIQLLKAATNALKKFGQAYVEEHMEVCINSNVDIKTIESDLKNVISSAFSL